tara:strand:+ start:13025 stop:13432 length:408 start_codon:yes stop_codon:yes gene_type:complete
MKKKLWQEMTYEEQQEILEDLKGSWPSFRYDHPRSRNLNTWRNPNLEDFVAYMNAPLHSSWIQYQNEYNRLRREERQKDMVGFLEHYSKTQPLAAKMIEDIYASPRDYKTVKQMTKMVLDFFPPRNWPITRGEEE